MNADRYMVDGALRTAEEARAIFRPGQQSAADLSVRQREALRLVGRAVTKGRLLDVGCYAGTFLEALRRTYPEIEPLGVDAYSDNIRIAQLLYPEYADTFSTQSAYSLKFASDTFDCAVFLEVIEHLDRPVDAIREINRVIRPGGHLVLSTPNGVSRTHISHTIVRGYKNAILSLLRRPHLMPSAPFFENVDWNRHLIEFSLMSLHTLLAMNGFELVEHRFISTAARSSPIDIVVPGLAKGQIMLLRKVRSAPVELI